MGTKFADFMRGIEEEAKAESPAAVAELEAYRAHFRLGRELAQARLSKNLTQKEVATRAGIDQADLSKIERGMSNPTIETFSAVALAVDCELGLNRRRR